MLTFSLQNDHYFLQFTIYFLFFFLKYLQGYSRTRELDSEELLEQLPALQQLLYRLIGCRVAYRELAIYLFHPNMCTNLVFIILIHLCKIIYVAFWLYSQKEQLSSTTLYSMRWPWYDLQVQFCFIFSQIWKCYLIVNGVSKREL